MRKKSSRGSLVAGNWNVRTLVECCGDLRVWRKRTDGRSEGVDRKLDLLVHELQYQ